MLSVHSPEFSRKAKIGLWVLTSINLLNYLDRYVVSALVESLKKSELRISDTEVGLLMTSFMVAYMCTSPFFGIWGDKISRPKLLAFGIAIWSLATGLAGFAKSFTELFLARAAVGVGEAAYATIAPALLADYFPQRIRGRIFSIFYAAIPIGSALGYVTGGMIDQHWGWRSAFFVVGFPGLLLAFLAMNLLDPPRGAQEEENAHESLTPGFASYLKLLKNRTYLFTVLGLAAFTFAIGGLAFWMPAFLERVRGLSKNEATILFGGAVILTGFLGTLSGGFLGDYFLKYSKRAYLYVSGGTMLLAVPLSYFALRSTNLPLYYSSIVIALFLLFISTGPINSTIAGSVNVSMRASAFAASNFLIHLLGDVPSPPLIGAISDATSLATGVMVVPVFILLSGLLWIFTARLAQVV